VEQEGTVKKNLTFHWSSISYLGTNTKPRYDMDLITLCYFLALCTVIMRVDFVLEGNTTTKTNLERPPRQAFFIINHEIHHTKDIDNSTSSVRYGIRYGGNIYTMQHFHYDGITTLYSRRSCAMANPTALPTSMIVSA
jgi:hypothetical protein